MKNTLFTLTKILKITYGFNKRYVIGIFFLSLLSLIIPIWGLYNTQSIVNGIQLGLSLKSPIMITSLIVFPIITLLTELINRILGYLTARYNDIVNYKYSCMILKKVHSKGLNDFENSEFYDLLQRAEEAGGIYPYSIVTGIINIITLIISSLSYIMILFNWKSWTIFFLLIFPFLSSIQIISISKNEFRILFNRTTIERKSWYYAHLQNKDINIKETILFSLFDYFYNKFTTIREAFLVENKKMYIRRNVSMIMIQTVSIASTMVILYMVFYEASLGIILIGSLMTYISSVSNLKTSFTNISSSVFKIHSDSLYAKNIIDFLCLKERDSNNIQGRNINEIFKVELQNVSYKYHNTASYALRNINLTLERGKNFILVGRNGSGKTTLSKLILGFYEDYEGSILINGIDLKTIDISSYRKCISAVFQDFTRYQSTIGESIIVSNLSKTDNPDLKKAAEKANADVFIEKYSKKYEQQVGSWFQDGVQLSGGEWQKLAIARAFHRDSASLVICDEPSSSLDPISEKKIFLNYLQLVEGKIGVFVTHRLKTFDFDGTILVLKNGYLVEIGDENELLMIDGEFKALYNEEVSKDEV